MTTIAVAQVGQNGFAVRAFNPSTDAILGGNGRAIVGPVDFTTGGFGRNFVVFNDFRDNIRICSAIGNDIYTRNSLFNIPPEPGVSSIGAPNVCRALTVGNVDGDAIAEIVVGYGGNTTIFPNRVLILDVNPVTLAITAHPSVPAPVPNNVPVGAGILGDTDADGNPEFVIGTHSPGNNILVYEWNGAGWSIIAQAHHGGTNGTVTALKVGEVDGDGEPEIVVLGDNIGNGGMGIYRFEGGSIVSDGTILNNVGLGSGAFQQIAIGDLDGNGTNEIIFSKDGNPQNTTLEVFEHTGGNVFNRDGTSGVLILSNLVSALDVGDSNLDGRSEIYFSAHNQNLAYIEHIGTEGNFFPSDFSTMVTIASSSVNTFISGALFVNGSTNQLDGDGMSDIAIIEDSGGSGSTRKVFVLEDVRLSADAGADQEICVGTSITLGATPAVTGGTSPYSFNWTASPSDPSLTSPMDENPVVSPTVTTTYTLTVTDADLATDADDVTITVNPPPTATVSGDASICLGSSATISVELTGTAPWNITWFDGFVQNGVPSSPATRLVNPTISTEYKVTSVSDAICAGTFSGSAVVFVTGITSLSTGAQSPCNPSANTYTQQVIVTYMPPPPPTLASLVVNGQSFDITTSPQTVTLTGLTSDGNPVNVTASFSDNPSCGDLTETALFTAPPSCSGSSLMYMTDRDLFTIFRANLDGSGNTALFPHDNIAANGIAVDGFNNKIYWTEDWGIRCADLDGSNARIVLTPPEAEITGGPALDVLGGKIYWAEFCCKENTGNSGIGIQRANLDGSNIETLLTLPTEFTRVRAIALDLIGGKIYWTLDASGGSAQDSKIQRANLRDGSQIEDRVTAVLDQPMGIALDIDGGWTYWADRRLGVIQRTLLNGTGMVETLVSSIGGAGGVALDVPAGKLYWTERLGARSVFRANLDGSGGAENLAPVGVNGPEFIALYLGPVNTLIGTNVNVSPQDATSGDTPVELIFDEVTISGNTTLTTSSSGPPPTSGFLLGDPPVYYDLSTTATFTGNIEVCFNYTGITFTDESALSLQHFEGGRWVDVTTSRDPVNDIICGIVTSLSPFAILEPVAIPVTVDIKPGDSPNSINPNDNNLIPVAILTTATFDATTVDPLSIKFGPNGAKEAHNKGHIEDADEDGDLDLVLHFKTPETGIQCGQTQASLTGQTFGGQAVTGTDDIQTIGCTAKSAAEEEASIPEEYALEQNYPNPFNPETEIRFQLPEAGQVSVKIFNTLGLEIRTLVDEKRAAGYHLVRWDGKDEAGNPVVSGVYLYQLRAGNPSTGSGQGFSQVRKMSLLR